MRAPTWIRSAPWWLGFLLVVNLYLIPGSGTSPRGTDLIGAGLAVWVLVRAHRRGIRALPLAVLAVANLLPVVWLFFSYLDGDRGTLVLAARWLLSIPWAIALVEMLRDRRALDRFAWGLLVGCGANVAVVLMQFLQIDAILRPFGMSVGDQDMATWVGKQTRLPGLHRHYGATSAVTSLILPPALWFYLRGRHGLWLPLLALGGLAITLHLTFTRSPLVVAMVTVLAAVATARLPRRSVTLTALLAAVAIPALIAIGPPGGAVRWSDTASFQANALERVRSTWVGFALSVEHPLGLGQSEARRLMIDETALTATHNAFVQAGLFFGVPLALALVVAFVHLAWGLTRGAQSEGWFLALLAVHLTGLFLFEEHLNNPTFLVLASWLIAASADRLEHTRRPRSAATA
jgi:hypothetical protein